MAELRSIPAWDPRASANQDLGSGARALHVLAFCTSMKGPDPAFILPPRLRAHGHSRGWLANGGSVPLPVPRPEVFLAEISDNWVPLTRARAPPGKLAGSRQGACCAQYPWELPEDPGHSPPQCLQGPHLPPTTALTELVAGHLPGERRGYKQRTRGRGTPFPWRGLTPPGESCSLSAQLLGFLGPFSADPGPGTLPISMHRADPTLIGWVLSSLEERVLPLCPCNGRVHLALPARQSNERPSRP